MIQPLRKSIYAFGLMFLIYASGCKVPVIETANGNLQMPDSFPGGTVNTSTALPDWRSYYKDSLLVQLIDSALLNSPDIQMVLQRMEVAGNDLRQASGALIPTAGANLAYLQRKFGYYTMDDAGNRTTYIRPGEFVPTHLPDYLAGFQAAWEADIWGKLRSRKRAALARYQASLEASRLAVTTLVSEVALTYYELQALDEELRIIRKAIDLQRAALDVVKVQKEAGLITELAVKQFEAQVLNSGSLEFQTLQRIALQENRMLSLMGRFTGRIVRSNMYSIRSQTDSVAGGSPTDLLSNRPDIRQAEKELVAAGYDLYAARASFYPAMNITAMAGLQSFRTDLLFDFPRSLAYNLLGGMTAPLLNRSALKAQYRSAGARQLETMYRYRKTVIQGFLEVVAEISNIRNLRSYTALKKQEADALNVSVSISDDLFRTGRANYLEVLMIQHNALLAGLELTEAEKRSRQASVNLYRALGGGWAAGR